MSETASPPAEAPPLLPLFFRRVVGVNPELHGGLRLDRAPASATRRRPRRCRSASARWRRWPSTIRSCSPPARTRPRWRCSACGRARTCSCCRTAAGGRTATSRPMCAPSRSSSSRMRPPRRSMSAWSRMPTACARMPGRRCSRTASRPRCSTRAVAFCAALRDNLNAATAFGRALEAESLLEDEEANIAFSHGGAARVRGFRVVKPERLDQVSDETFLDWRRRGWIAADLCPSVFDGALGPADRAGGAGAFRVTN